MYVKTSLGPSCSHGYIVPTSGLYSRASHEPLQQDWGTSFPQSLALLTPQQSNWNKSFREKHLHVIPKDWARDVLQNTLHIHSVTTLHQSHLRLNQIPLIDHICCWVSRRSRLFCLLQTLIEIVWHPFSNLNTGMRDADYTCCMCVSFISTTQCEYRWMWPYRSLINEQQARYSQLHQHQKEQQQEELWQRRFYFYCLRRIQIFDSTT